MVRRDPHLPHSLMLHCPSARRFAQQDSCIAERTPTAVTILSLLEGLQHEPAPLHFDHLAFRTFGVRMRCVVHAV